MNVQYLKLTPLTDYRNWAYDIQEVAPGAEEVRLYRDGVLRFSSPVVLPQERMLLILSEAAARIEFDIQRKICRQLYGYESVRSGGGVWADMANSNVRSYLARHAMPLKQVGCPDSGVKLDDVSGFLNVIGEAQLQILAIESFEVKHESAELSCGELWRFDDMKTPSMLSLNKNRAIVSGVFDKERMMQQGQRMYSFVIDSRKIVSIGE